MKKLSSLLCLAAIAGSVLVTPVFAQTKPAGKMEKMEKPAVKTSVKATKKTKKTKHAAKMTKAAKTDKTTKPAEHAAAHGETKHK